jgi:hypothetical protein
VIIYKTVCRINDITYLDPFDTLLLTQHSVSLYDTDHDTYLRNGRTNVERRAERVAVLIKEIARVATANMQLTDSAA